MASKRIIPFVEWAEKNIMLENKKMLRLEKHQKKILGLALKVDRNGKLKYSTVVYSCIKKSGKTTVEAVVVLWFAYELAPGTELILAANDLEQSSGRAFKMAKKIINRNPILKSRVMSMTAKEIILNDGTTIKAIPTDAAGESGANQSFSGFDELWGFYSERSRRLWDELTPPPTQKNSIRFVTTYAGYTGESELLEDLYNRGIKGKRILGDLPVYESGSLFFYWDHEPRMPWQTPEYYAEQKAELRPIAYLRLHENRWVTSESGMFDMDDWDACVDPNHFSPFPDKKIRLSVGIDVSTKNDRSAVVSVYEDESGLKLGPKCFWQPSKANPMDFEETVEAFLLELKRGYSLKVCRYDPYQFHGSATRLRKRGLPMEEYAQTVPNLTSMGQNLYDLIKFKNLTLYACDEMRLEASRAIAKDAGRGLQICKEKSAHKIDQIVSLAMAAAGKGKLLVTPRIAFVSPDLESEKPFKMPTEEVKKPTLKPGQSLVAVDVGGVIVAYEVIGGNKKTYLPGISGGFR